MNNSIEIKENELIETLANFFLVNSEVVKSNSINGKMSLVYFLFNYSKISSKECFSQFAFELLEDILKEELYKGQSTDEDFYSGITGIGWGLMIFIKEGFFESDDINEILEIIDNKVFFEIEDVSRTDFELIYIEKLIGLGLYLKERIALSTKNEIETLAIKEHLLIVMFELSSGINQISNKNHELLEFCKCFFQEGLENKMISHFCLTGIQNINNLTSINDNKEIEDKYKVALKSNEFENIILYNTLFSKQIDDQEKFSKLIEEYTITLIDSLCFENSHEVTGNIQELITIATSLISQNKSALEKEYKFYYQGFRMNSKKTIHQRHELNDVTFLIYVKIDSEDRLLNLELVLKHILKYFNTSVFLLEVDNSPKISEKITQNHAIEYEFYEDTNDVFHTTKYRNYMVEKCKTSCFFVCDTDVIVDPKAILQCRDYLMDNPKDKILVYPYDGVVYNISKQCRNEYLKTNRYEFLKKKEREHTLWVKNAIGGILGGKTSDFKEYKIDNNNIYGWGPDDKERYYRLKRSGFKIMRSKFPLYHLYHVRGKNSKPMNHDIEIKNQIEYLELFAK